MIEFIRNRLNSVFVLLLLGLLIASFAFFGIGDVVQVGQGDTIAKVGERRITVVELSQTFETFVERQRAENPELTQASAIRSNVDRILLQQLIQQALMTQAATDVGLTASPRQTQAMVAAIPAFQVAGKFDVETYKGALGRIGVSEEQLFNDIRRQQLIEQVERVLNGAAYVPEALANAQIAVLLETRSADALVLPFTQFEAEVGTPTDEQVEAFFSTVSSAYNAPEYRSFSAVYLTSRSVADDITVAEEDLLQAYELRREEFGDTAKLDLQLVVFDTRGEAEAFKAGAVNGALYLDLASETGATRDDISIGELTRPEIVNLYSESVADALFGLSAGDVSEPLEGPFGYLVFRLAGKTAETIEAYDDVKDALRKEIAQQIALDRLADVGNAFEDEFAAGATLEEAAKTFGLDVTVYDMVTDTGLTQRGTLAPQQSDLQTILPDIFKSPLDNELEVLRLGENGYYIARLDKVEQTRPQTLDEVKPQVVEAWEAAELDRLALAAADDIATQVRGGASMQDISAEKDYQYLPGIRFNRIQARQGSLANADLAPLLFSMDEGEVDVGRSGGGNSYVIAKMTKIEDGDPNTNRALVDQFRSQLEEYIGQEVQQQYLTGAAGTIATDINARALETFRKRYDPTL